MDNEMVFSDTLVANFVSGMPIAEALQRELEYADARERFADTFAVLAELDDADGVEANARAVQTMLRDGLSWEQAAYAMGCQPETLYDLVSTHGDELALVHDQLIENPSTPLIALERLTGLSDTTIAPWAKVFGWVGRNGGDGPPPLPAKARVRELVEDGAGNAHIALTLEVEGFEHPSGESWLVDGPARKYLKVTASHFRAQLRGAA